MLPLPILIRSLITNIYLFWNSKVLCDFTTFKWSTLYAGNLKKNIVSSLCFLPDLCQISSGFVKLFWVVPNIYLPMYQNFRIYICVSMIFVFFLIKFRFVVNLKWLDILIQAWRRITHFRSLLFKVAYCCMFVIVCYSWNCEYINIVLNFVEFFVWNWRVVLYKRYCIVSDNCNG